MQANSPPPEKSSEGGSTSRLEQLLAEDTHFSPQDASGCSLMQTAVCGASTVICGGQSTCSRTVVIVVLE
ncbi:hypothetical protein KCH_05650 [Kitasatospora cheerisanensis KCTC 2395]|uniref:Uncharacterized protein n=1 Tax=Kitasatospora cheerisanensis KCTC 2395 TaxID=1348663 RepID=A0A066Z5W6_9ACTN|nr:hypothetical protein KCH_05650 [Kitasatospora cheerisanensis KCTC 2395]